MFLLRAVLNILVRNASPRGPMCFRCLIFNLSGTICYRTRNDPLPFPTVVTISLYTRSKAVSQLWPAL